MVQKYFDAFPIITYANNQAVDITKRAMITDSLNNNPYVYYPYNIESFERADQISNEYYSDSYKSWIIYLTNDIVDPYYEWYMHQDEFTEHIKIKYGSIETATDKIKFYRNNYQTDEGISVSRFNSLLADQIKYWDPVYSSKGKIISYKRKPIDWIVNTNKIVSYTVSNTAFITNEIVDIEFNNNNIGKGQIASVTSNTVYIQHVSGVYTTNSNVAITVGSSYIYGRESQVNTNFYTSVVSGSNISADEEPYWSGVSYYDFESEKNEYNKSVRMLDNRYSTVFSNNFRDIMKI